MRFISAIRPLLLVTGVLLLGAASASAQTCGNGAGPRGRNLRCECGDTVITSTVLTRRDPVLRKACTGNGLTVAAGITLNLNGGIITGSGSGVGVRPGAGATVTNGAVRGFGTGVLVQTGNVVLTGVAADSNFGSGVIVSPSLGAAPVVSFSGPGASASDNGSTGIVILTGGALEISGDTPQARLPILRNGGFGMEVRGELLATNVKIGESADHGILVESDVPVEFVNCQVNNSGNHPAETNADRAGVLALRASGGLTWRGVESVVRDNTGHGFVLGHATDQSGPVRGRISDTQIYANNIGIYVEQKDLTVATTTSKILANNIYGNRGSGVYIKTSYQDYFTNNFREDRAFSSNDVHRNAVTPVETNVCTAAAGARQSASQIVFDGPIATMDLDFDPAMGPDATAYPDDSACYWGPDPGATPIATEAECNNLNNPAPAFGDGVIRHCIWNGSQCRIAWDMGGTESSGSCDSARNRVWNYVNLPISTQTTQRGVAALNGAYVRARRNQWGAGGADDASAVDSGFGSVVDAENPCPGTETSCVGYDQAPRD